MKESGWHNRKQRSQRPRFTDYIAERVRTIFAGPDELRARWADASQRAFSRAADLKPGDRVKTIRGKTRGVVLRILADARPDLRDSKTSTNRKA